MANIVTAAGLLWAVSFPLTATMAQQVRAERSRLVITAQEIATVKSEDAFQVVEKLRPEYFRRAERNRTVYGGERAADIGPRAPTAEPTAAALKLTVFVNGNELGDAQQLRQIRADDVQEIRYLSGPDAQIKLGPRYAGGVLEVRLKS